MKINIEIDITPEEFRKSMGWPDVEAFNRELLDKLRQQMEAGAEGFDPLTLLKPYLTQSASSMEGFQKIMSGMMEGYFRGPKGGG
ncbi:MAG: hypothetical protein B0D96_03780 [Candidatus Sedimenticola endophacoides]|uniref:Uncharacterized protein n=1 Tax=Candidatus Sedimenticola endophacoides TaxID=2548426 RepID=A0A6N4E0C4_9GAMM|nr:MAG: hypothetical protein B0D94_11225 [Candidatus Sedimenticola endophacoides]OQX36634.1 MAG: hypothetical protein B0D96_03780 [Candidatus Sedimenticola endophacoides]OQX41571.1 MAG: hypothetical protein B0D89_03610 [Candidatus Sedimenticola endophacoides]PUE01415.1 MAG: hypothetical protein C3L26_03385 [Candidatus Sedimenticola endophacoides]PUE04239.1 MAG: hypothetical protein C3L24_03535 [Candidatus Sedimenticola endophacoides]